MLFDNISSVGPFASVNLTPLVSVALSFLPFMSCSFSSISKPTLSLTADSIEGMSTPPIPRLVRKFVLRMLATEFTPLVSSFKDRSMVIQQVAEHCGFFLQSIKLWINLVGKVLNQELARYRNNIIVDDWIQERTANKRVKAWKLNWTGKVNLKRKEERRNGWQQQRSEWPNSNANELIWMNLINERKNWMNEIDAFDAMMMHWWYIDH